MASTLTSLRITDHTDRELLLVIMEIADNEGYAETKDIARRLRLRSPKDDPNHGSRSVGSRLARMRMFEVVDRHPQRTAWRVTDTGEAFATGALGKGFERNLGDLSEADLILVQRSVTKRMREGDYTTRQMLRREYTNGTANLNGRPARRRR